jgi:vesicular inhibitory amino acid transporter
LSDIIFTLLYLHPAIYIPNSTPTPRYTTRPSSPVPSSHSEPIPHILDQEEISHDKWERKKKILRPTIRVLLAVAAVVGGIILPSFESVMALLGSGFALVTVIIIPIWAGAKLWGWTWYASVIAGLSGVVAVVGVVTSFWPA